MRENNNHVEYFYLRMEVIEYSVTKGSEVIKIPSVKIHLCTVKRN